jgi:Ca2+:H+ antiporter
VTVIETALIARLGVPKEVVGTVVAALVLLPETLRLPEPRADRLQTSLNASQPRRHFNCALLAPTLLLTVITLGAARITVPEGVVHLLIFAVFLFLSWLPEFAVVLSLANGYSLFLI